LAKLNKRPSPPTAPQTADPGDQVADETVRDGHSPPRPPPPASPADTSQGWLKQRLAALSTRVGPLVSAIESSNEARIEEAVLRLSSSRRVFAPLAFAIGAFVLLFDGLRLLVTNWRLTVVQTLPAMWIWLAMFDLKAHALHGKSFDVLRGPVLIPICLVIVAITMASLFLNAVFAFAITRPQAPEVRPAVARAQGHLKAILISGGVLGLLLALSTTVVTRWGRPWFTLSLGIVVALMMISYVAVPARLIGVKPTQTRRDKLSTTVVGGVLGATVCTPPYVLGRVGLLMLGSKVLLIPGIIVVVVAVALQAGATGAVRAIKMSAKLTSTRHRESAARSPEP
jgi:hypothetical protein